MALTGPLCMARGCTMTNHEARRAWLEREIALVLARWAEHEEANPADELLAFGWNRALKHVGASEHLRATIADFFDAPMREVEEALDDIHEYWNGLENESAMKDTCHHAIAEAHTALARLPWREKE